MSENMVQAAVFAIVTGVIGLLTYLKCRGHGHNQQSQNKEYFLAGGGLHYLNQFEYRPISWHERQSNGVVGLVGICCSYRFDYFG